MESSSRDYSTSHFGRRAGICRGNSDGKFIVGRSLSNIELLLCYSIPYSNLPLHLDSTSFDEIIDDCLPHSTPWNTKHQLLLAYVDWCDIINLHYLSSSEHVDNMQCYVTRSHNDTLDWKTEYDLDMTTKQCTRYLTI